MIRAATPGDIETLIRLHGECFPKAWSAQEFGRLLAIPGTFALLAADNAGFVLARVAADEAEVLSIGVGQRRRRQGIGRALMQAAAAEAELRGARHLYLEVSCNNRGARALYNGLGFIEAGRRSGYYRDEEGAADALTLKAALPLILGKGAGLD